MSMAMPWLLCACASSAPTQPREVLDESSGVTLIVTQHPMVFARPRVDVAAHTRDYVTLVAAEEDRSGKYTAWLIAHRWSTVDPRMENTTDPAKPQLHIIADDRDLTLTRAEPAPGFLARSDLLFAPHAAGAQSAAYAVDEATLRYIASSSRLLVRADADALTPAYTLWDDGRAALQSLLSAVGSPSAVGLR